MIHTHRIAIYCIALLISSQLLAVAAKNPVKTINKPRTSQPARHKLTPAKPKPAKAKPKSTVTLPVPIVPAPITQPVFVVESAHYSLEPVSLANTTLVPNIQQKLLVMELSSSDLLQVDPTRSDVRLNATDGATTWPASSVVNTAGQNEKLRIMAAFIIPASAKISIVNLDAGDKMSVALKLEDKITGFSSPLADSNDPAIPLARVSATTGIFYPAGTLLMKLDKAGYTFGPIDGKQAADDARFLTLSFIIKNLLSSALVISSALFDTILIDADGAIVKLKMSPGSCTIESGKENVISFYGELAADNYPGTFSIKQGNEGRLFVFDLSGVK